MQPHAGTDGRGDNSAALSNITAVPTHTPPAALLGATNNY